jgi:Reverse transcriptase (RNA-dependent DNA polymerase)
LGSNASGASGPDGFTFAFYQHFWDIIQADLLLLITYFYNNFLRVAHINHVMLCLLLKEHEASIIQKFRPISLLGCSYKILTNRLAHMVYNIVDEAQTIFIQGRFILDNVLAAHKIIHFIKTTKQKVIILNVDFEKAYDRVSWDFLKDLLVSRGFGMVWSNWIENLLVGAKTCVNFNGNLTQYFQCKRGIRQGDPLSPFLFDLVIDTLCQLLIRGNELGLLNGLGPVLANEKQIINFHYADDTIFFLQADPKCVETVL